MVVYKHRFPVLTHLSQAGLSPEHYSQKISLASAAAKIKFTLALCLRQALHAALTRLPARFEGRPLVDEPSLTEDVDPEVGLLGEAELAAFWPKGSGETASHVCDISKVCARAISIRCLVYNDGIDGSCTGSEAYTLRDMDVVESRNRITGAHSVLHSSKLGGALDAKPARGTMTSFALQVW